MSIKVYWHEERMKVSYLEKKEKKRQSEIWRINWDSKIYCLLSKSHWEKGIKYLSILEQSTETSLRLVSNNDRNHFQILFAKRATCKV